MLKKTSTAVKNYIGFLIRFSWKPDLKWTGILRKTLVAAKIDKKLIHDRLGSLRGSSFVTRGRFLVNLCVRLGARNGIFGVTFGWLSRLFGQLLASIWFFFARGRSGRVPRMIWDVLGTLRERILVRVLVILCVASVIRGVLVLFQLCPKFVTIPDQSLFYRRCLALVCQPSVAGAAAAF